MISIASNNTEKKKGYKLYLAVLVLIPLNFVTPSDEIGVSIFSLGFIAFGLLSVSFLLYAITHNSNVIIIKNRVSALLILILFVSITVAPWSINIQNSVSDLVRLGYHVSAAIFISTFLSTYWDDFGLILIPKIIAITSSIVAVTVITDYFSLTSFGTLPGREWSHPDRAAGVVAEPNFAAGLLAISLPFFVYFLSVKDQSLRSRIPHLIGIIMTISAIYFTGSRMGILLVMFFIVGVVIIHRDILMKTPLIVPTLVALPVGLYVLTVFQPTTIQRFTRLISYLQGGVGDGSIRERIDLIIAGIDMVEKNLLTGVGPGNFINAIVNYPDFDSVRYSHNTYIDVASQIGIIGFFSFLLLLTYIFKRLLYIGHNDLSAHYILSYLILLGYLLFLSNFFSTYLWFVFIPLSITIENNMGVHR